MLRPYAFKFEFTINGERHISTIVASCDDNARRDLCFCYPVDVGSIHLIVKKPA